MLEPLPLLRLSARCFVQAIQGMASKNDADSVRLLRTNEGASGAAAAADGQGGLDASLERGEGLSEADAWFKTLECIVETLPVPPEAAPDAREDDSGTRASAWQTAIACESECALLVEQLLPSTAHASEAVTAIILRALGIFSQLYNRATDRMSDRESHRPIDRSNKRSRDRAIEQPSDPASDREI